MKVLVTGGLGYVGSVLLKRLLAQGHAVCCFDRSTSSLARLRLTPAEEDRCGHVVGDVRDAAAVAAAAADADAVVHLAAIVGSPACDADPDAARSINVTGTEQVARAVPPGVPLVYLSTCSVYGAADGLCRERDPVRPLTLYGETKWQAENAVIGRGGVVLRATTAFGASPSFRGDLLVHTFIRLAITKRRIALFEPDAIRPLIDVDDIARALLFAVEFAGTMSGNVYNIGSDDATMTKLELARRIGTLIPGANVEVIPGHDPDGRTYRVAFDEIEAIGYRTARPFAAALAETTAWMGERFAAEPA